MQPETRHIEVCGHLRALDNLHPGNSSYYHWEGCEWVTDELGTCGRRQKVPAPSGNPTTEVQPVTSYCLPTQVCY
jgi:hypothetical protein